MLAQKTNDNSAFATIAPNKFTVQKNTDGTVTFRRDTYALGVVGNSTSLGATLEWQTYSSTNSFQKWNLETTPFNLQRGDVNGDGVVDIKDMIEVAMVGTSMKQFKAWGYYLADMNCDGVIDENDVNFIVEFFS